MACPKIEKIIENFNVFTEKPVKFLTVQNELKDDIKTLVKSVYDFNKSGEKVDKRKKKGALPELIVQDFDEEQIWQQIELQNNECWDQLVWEVASCMSLKDELKFPITTAAINSGNNLDAEISTTPSSKKKSKHAKKNKNPASTEVLNDEINAETKRSQNLTVKKSDKTKSRVKSSIVDDQFFKLQEMEQFLLKEEKNEGKKRPVDSDEESIDLFDVIDSEGEEDEGARVVKYSGFFDDDEQENGDDFIGDETGSCDDALLENDLDDDENDIQSENQEESKKPKQKDKRVRFDDASSSDEPDSDQNDIVADKQTDEILNEKKSDFEMRQERLKKTIDRLEAKTLNEAPWQLKGEVDASKRPQNSLLEEVVDFDLTSRPAPIITEQTTLTLEDLIRQRIKDKAWDDVEKKEKPVDDQLNFRKTEILDHAKSKLSLAQVYEAEYLKQKQANSGEIEEEKEPEAHTQIRDTMTQLFAKLDALCHYHYTPKAAQAEVKIVSNTPAISMEEVAPVATSDATLLAPEEVKKKRRGELMMKEERTQTDKNRERRKKKKFQRAKGGQVTKITDHRNTKKGVEANDKSLKTSKAFFQQLNDDSTSLIKSKKNVKFGKNKGK